MPSGRLRSAGPAALVLGSLVLASLLVGACTAGGGAVADGSGPRAVHTARTASVAVSPGTTGEPGGADDAGDAGASAGVVGSAAPASTPTVVGDSTMTAVPEASGCVTVIQLGNRAPVRAEQLWPGAGEIGSDAVEARARAGGAGCDGALPASPDCDLSLPWAALDAEELLRMSGADRVISGRAYARLAASSASVTSAASLLYLTLDFSADRRRSLDAREWFAAAVTTCGLGGPGSLAGVSGLVGERHKPTLGSGDAGRFLITDQNTSRGTQLVCLVFEGAAWSPTSRADAVRRVLPLLRAA